MGSDGSGFILIHHERPLSEAHPGFEVAPIEDLKSLCPNCRAIVHKRTPPYTPKEARRRISDGGQA